MVVPACCKTSPLTGTACTREGSRSLNSQKASCKLHLFRTATQCLSLHAFIQTPNKLDMQPHAAVLHMAYSTPLASSKVSGVSHVSEGLKYVCVSRIKGGQMLRVQTAPPRVSVWTATVTQTAFVPVTPGLLWSPCKPHEIFVCVWRLLTWGCDTTTSHRYREARGTVQCSGAECGGVAEETGSGLTRFN